AGRSIDRPAPPAQGDSHAARCEVHAYSALVSPRASPVPLGSQMPSTRPAEGQQLCAQNYLVVSENLTQRPRDRRNEIVGELTDFCDYFTGSCRLKPFRLTERNEGQGGVSE
ncbi:hypothetical protein, partial [Streptomyces violascens]|uniref:hypothetical protein n=1 Tax=Streptomyces violascens TaxID=67381 RepID=UPI00366A52D9